MIVEKTPTGIVVFVNDIQIQTWKEFGGQLENCSYSLNREAIVELGLRLEETIQPDDFINTLGIVYEGRSMSKGDIDPKKYFLVKNI